MKHNLQFMIPLPGDKQNAIAFMNEFPKDAHVSGSGSLDEYLRTKSYEEWLQKLHEDADFANTKEDRCPAITYFAVDMDSLSIVGIIQCRFERLTQRMTEFGHIGCSVRPNMRKIGYGTQILQMALDMYTRMGMHAVYITCDDDNVASQMIIERNGGCLMSVQKMPLDLPEKRLYRIDLRWKDV